MAKAALEALALTLAKEERRNDIHVNVVAPGLVDTEMGRRLVKGAMGVEDIRTMDAGAAVRSRVHPRRGRRRRAVRRLGTSVVPHRPADRGRRRFVLSRFEQRSCGHIYVVAAKVVAAALVAVIAVGACSGGDDERDRAENGSSTGTGSEDGSRGDAPCEPEADEQPARAVLRCGEPSIAYVATQFGTGTGVAIALDGERYVLTNQHVVDPYDAADVQFGADPPERDVPLVGADVAADIALLGPIEARVPTLDISDSAGLERGDEVFLVGFPGESSGDEHEATIAAGIVARLREAEEWDQRYIQTDAAIAGGQSGGPLFDDTRQPRRHQRALLCRRVRARTLG